VRHLISVRLIDVSAVSQPAYPDATVGLRSLALQFDADSDDVFDIARENQLLKLFCRTDTRGQPVKTRSGHDALRELMAMTADEKRPRTWHQREVQLMAMRWPEDRANPMTVRQKQTEVARMAVPPERRSGRSAWLETDAMRED
jgi:hypothetical protein